MADLFDVAARELERHSGLAAIEARGTLRIALKAGGLSPRGLALEPLRAVLERLMPRELTLRGVEQASEVCRAVLADVVGTWDGAETERRSDADEIFRRLGGS